MSLDQTSPLLQKLMSSNSELTDAQSALLPKYHLPSDAMNYYKIYQNQLEQQQLEQLQRHLLKQQMYNSNFYNNFMNSDFFQNRLTTPFSNAVNSKCFNCIENKLATFTSQTVTVESTFETSSKANNIFAASNTNTFSSILPINDIYNSLGLIFEKFFGSKYLFYVIIGVLMTLTILILFCYIYCCCCSKKSCIEKMFCCCCCRCSKKKSNEKKKLPISTKKKLFCFA